MPGALCGLDVKNKERADRFVSSREMADIEQERIYRCAACGFDITSEKDRVGINASHEHTFVNPGGYVYCIGCFRVAPGCLQVGEPTSEHTWFQGYSWLYALCGHCTSHLGWHYRSGANEPFYGLILERLIAP